MLRLLCLIATAAIANAALPTCSTKKWTLKKVGCYADGRNPRPMDKQLVNMRDTNSKVYGGYLLNWGNMKPSVDRILCDCAKIADSKGYKFIGLQHFGECWSGAGSYSANGATDTCRNPNQLPYVPCSDGDGNGCVGMGNTNYVYELEPNYNGNWGQWGQESICSKSCGGGIRTRTRECRPKGAFCKGSAVESKPCNTEKCEEPCHEVVDLGVVLDASGSVKAHNFKLMLDFVSNLTSYYGVNPGEVHFGAMHYSSRPSLDWKISNQAYWDNTKLAAKVLRIPYTRGGTRTDLAMKYAEQQFFCGTGCGRPNAQRSLLVFTDGKNNVYLKPSVTAGMKAKGVKVIAIGIKGAVQAELERLASNKDDVINIKEFKYLVDKINKIIHLTCERRGITHPTGPHPHNG